MLACGMTLTHPATRVNRTTYVAAYQDVHVPGENPPTLEPPDPKNCSL